MAMGGCRCVPPFRTPPPPPCSPPPFQGYRCNMADATAIVAGFFFPCFVLSGTFVMLNLVIAVIIDNFIESAQSEGLLKVRACIVVHSWELVRDGWREADRGRDVAWRDAKVGKGTEGVGGPALHRPSHPPTKSKPLHPVCAQTNNFVDLLKMVITLKVFVRMLRLKLESLKAREAARRRAAQARAGLGGGAGGGGGNPLLRSGDGGWREMGGGRATRDGGSGAWAGLGASMGHGERGPHHHHGSAHLHHPHLTAGDRTETAPPGLVASLAASAAGGDRAGGGTGDGLSSGDQLQGYVRPPAYSSAGQVGHRPPGPLLFWRGCLVQWEAGAGGLAGDQGAHLCATSKERRLTPLLPRLQTA